MIYLASGPVPPVPSRRRQRRLQGTSPHCAPTPGTPGSTGGPWPSTAPRCSPLALPVGPGQPGLPAGMALPAAVPLVRQRPPRHGAAAAAGTAREHPLRDFVRQRPHRRGLPGVVQGHPLVAAHQVQVPGRLLPVGWLEPFLAKLPDGTQVLRGSPGVVTAAGLPTCPPGSPARRSAGGPRQRQQS